MGQAVKLDACGLMLVACSLKQVSGALALVACFH